MFKGGQSNPTYKLITPARNYVMRSKPGPVAKLLPSAHAIEREFAVMSGLQGTQVPVPHMHVLCEDESIIGRAFYIMEYMEGRYLWHLNEALRRLYNSPANFGKCHQCGALIDFERLDALPHARLCISCKEKEEDAKKR